MPRFAVALLCLFLSLTSALAAPPERPEPGEVIDQVAKYTGLTNDTVSLALTDNAAALGRLTDAVQALQIAQQFLDAKNADIAATVFWSATDTAAEALLPPPLMTAIKAMRAYKSILEELRDTIFIPKLEDWLYNAYRFERTEGRPDADPLFVLKNADAAVKGYYPMKVAMVEELIKAKGWNVDVMGERLRRHAEAEIDRFWAQRLEATFQQEKVKPQKEAILAAIWGSVQDIINQLNAPGAAVDAGLFIDPARDLPSGWWWVKEGLYRNSTWGPRDLPGMGMPSMERQFVLSAAKGYSYNGQFNDYCRPDGRHVKCDLQAVQFGTIITRFPDAKAATDQATAFISGGKYAPTGKTAGMLNPHPSVLAVHLAYGAYDIHLTASATNAVQYLSLIEDFGRVIAKRIAAQAPSAGAAAR
jgi:hypothetical protein